MAEEIKNDQLDERIKTIAERSGPLGVFLELYDIYRVLDEFPITHYQVSGNCVYYNNNPVEVRDDDKGHKNFYICSSVEGDPLCGKMLTAYDLLVYTHFSRRVNGKPTKKAYEEADVAIAGLKDVLVYFCREPWETELTRDKMENVETTVYNVSLIMQKDEFFATLKYNNWKNRYEWQDEYFEDHHVNIFIKHIVERYGLTKLVPKVVYDSLPFIRAIRSYDPLVDYLEACFKDYGASGTEEIDHYLQEYLGAEDSDYIKEVGRLLLVGSVGRAFVPGIKFDTMFLLQGEKQGQGKSTLVAKLGAGFGTDNISLKDFENHQRLGEKLRNGAWLSEIPEMNGLKAIDENTLKALLSVREDTFRPAYGRTVETFKRRTVFIGTINNLDDVFTDVKNRRFIVVQCDANRQTKYSYEDSDLSEEDVRKLWGQAVALYRSGAYDKEGLILSKPSQAIAEKLCDSLVRHELALSQLEDYLRMPRGDDWDTLQKGDRAKRFKNFLEDYNAPLGDWVEVTSLPEIVFEMLGYDITNNVGDDRAIQQIKKELQRFGYQKWKKVPIRGYGKTVQVFRREVKNA